MSELKEALDFYEMNGYLTPDQCDVVVDRVWELEKANAELNREQAAFDKCISKYGNALEELGDE